MALPVITDRRDRPRLRSARTHLAIWLLAAVMGLSVPAFAGNAEQAPPETDWAVGAPVETSGLGAGPFADMGMLYERTLFRVDVLQLSLRFDAQTARALMDLAAGRHFDKDLAGSVAAVALGAHDVLVRSHFLRDISLDQFLDGMRDNLRHARNAGILTPAEQVEIVAGIESEYEVLREPGIHVGDTVWYRIRGDHLQVVFQAQDGSLTLDLAFEGAPHRRALLGGYLAPGSDFRSGLVRSVFARSAD